MIPHYSDWQYKGSGVAALAATKLYTARARKCRIAPMVLMTDPKRINDPIAAAHTMPEGSAIIYRHFGETDRLEKAHALRQVTFKCRQQFLIGHDPELAIKTGADGVHFKRGSNSLLPALWRSRIPDWLITMAGHKSDKIFTQPTSALDALFASSIFESASPSAGTPIGPDRLSQICKKLDAPIIALGGINVRTAGNLIDTGAAGLAGVSFT